MEKEEFELIPKSGLGKFQLYLRLMFSLNIVSSGSHKE